MSIREDIKHVPAIDDETLVLLQIEPVEHLKSIFLDRSHKVSPHFAKPPVRNNSWLAMLLNRTKQSGPKIFGESMYSVWTWHHWRDSKFSTLTFSSTLHLMTFVYRSNLPDWWYNYLERFQQGNRFCELVQTRISKSNAMLGWFQEKVQLSFSCTCTHQAVFIGAPTYHILSNEDSKSFTKLLRLTACRKGCFHIPVTMSCSLDFAAWKSILDCLIAQDFVVIGHFDLILLPLIDATYTHQMLCVLNDSLHNLSSCNF